MNDDFQRIIQVVYFYIRTIFSLFHGGWRMPPTESIWPTDVLWQLFTMIGIYTIYSKMVRASSANAWPFSANASWSCTLKGSSTHLDGACNTNETPGHPKSLSMRIYAPAEVDGGERDEKARAHEHRTLHGELLGVRHRLALVEGEVLRVVGRLLGRGV
jgi:hypothetical protein